MTICDVDGNVLFKSRHQDMRGTVRAALAKKMSLAGADLTGVNLSRLDFTKINLSGALLVEANLEKANLEDANLYKANLTRTNLTKAQLHWADLTDVSAVRANVKGTDLTEARLTSADFSGSNFYGAILDDAEVYGLNLYDAKNIIAFGPCGSRGDTLFAVRHQRKVMVKTGCYWGPVDQFVARVNRAHHAESQHPFAGKIYHSLVEVVKLWAAGE